MIKIQRIYESNSNDNLENNAIRILVDRLWPRGISKEKAKIDIWAKEIAPSNELRKWFNHDETKFKEFEEKYIKELNLNDYAIKFKKEYENKNLILLYSAKDTIHNNAIVLKNWLISEKD